MRARCVPSCVPLSVPLCVPLRVPERPVCLLVNSSRVLALPRIGLGCRVCATCVWRVDSLSGLKSKNPAEGLGNAETDERFERVFGDFLSI